VASEKLVAAVRILCLGDSYTIGEAVGAGERWPVRLAARARESGRDIADPVIVARTGWTTDELSAGIDAANPQGQFDIATLLIGVNNQYRGRSVDQYRLQFRELLNRAATFTGGGEKNIIVVSIPDWGVTPFARQCGRDIDRIGAEIDAFNAVGNDEASRAGASFVDVTPRSRRAAIDQTLIASDGLHPSGAMYEEWTDLILPVALRMLR
jgi:lysophospholipase L1-like esterase